VSKFAPVYCAASLFQLWLELRCALELLKIGHSMLSAMQPRVAQVFFLLLLLLMNYHYVGGSAWCVRFVDVAMCAAL